MEFLVKFASAFMSVFQAGGANFVSWVTGIIPTILMLLVMMNAIIALIGDERIEVIAKFCTSNPITRYAVLPWVSAFMLGNPMGISKLSLPHQQRYFPSHQPFRDHDLPRNRAGCHRTRT